MRISDWSSDVCSSDLEGEYDATLVLAQDLDRLRQEDDDDKGDDGKNYRVDGHQPSPSSDRSGRETSSVSPSIALTTTVSPGVRGSALRARQRSPRARTSPVVPLQPSTRTGWPTISASPVTTGRRRSEEHTSELQSLMRISYDVFRLEKK